MYAPWWFLQIKMLQFDFCNPHHLRTWSLLQEYSLHTLQPHNGDEPCIYPGRCSKQQMQCSTAGNLRNLSILFDTCQVAASDWNCGIHAYIACLGNLLKKALRTSKDLIYNTVNDFSLHGWYWTTDSKPQFLALLIAHLLSVLQNVATQGSLMMACSEGILWKESLQLLREMSTMQCLICKGSRPENRQAMIQDGSVFSRLPVKQVITVVFLLVGIPGGFQFIDVSICVFVLETVCKSSKVSVSFEPHC